MLALDGRVIYVGDMISALVLVKLSHIYPDMMTGLSMDYVTSHPAWTILGAVGHHI